MNYEEKILKDFDERFITKTYNPMGSEWVNSPNVIQDTTELKLFIAESIEQAEEETIKKVLEVIGKKKREASESIRIKADNFFSIGAMFVLDDLIASLQEEPEPNTE